MAEDILSAKELGVRSLPPGSPSHLEHILDELNDSLDQDAPGTALRVLKKAFSFLTGYFADLISGVAPAFGEITFKYTRRDDPVEAVQAIQSGLEFLIAKAPPTAPEVRALVDCFYEHHSARKFARILEIGGKPRRGVPTLDAFLTAAIPGRKKCVQDLRTYIPYLKEWLESCGPLFSIGAILSERTSLKGTQRIAVKLGRQTVQASKRIDIGGCPLCIPEKEIDVPVTLYERPVYFFVPQKAPPPLLDILNRLDLAMKRGNSVSGCVELRNALEFLIRYFAGVSSKLCEELEVLPKSAQTYIDNDRSLSMSERLLNVCLDVLKRMPDSPAAKVLMSVFYRRNEMFEFVPRWHTEILALRGQLSGWCQFELGGGELEDPEVRKIEFEKHVPTLREWLMALGGYLQLTEHFFNERHKEGYIEFSLRIGDRFIEVGEPGYVLWLNNPRPQGENLEIAAGAHRPLIRESLAIPEGCPEVLRRILTRMDIYLRRGEPIEACISLRDALDYMTRYFAGVAAAALRQLDLMTDQAEQLAEQSLSIHDCEKLLILALESIGPDCPDKLGQSVRGVFYYKEGFSHTERPTGAHSRLLALDADPNVKMQALAEFCTLTSGQGPLSHPARSRRELERFLPTLQDWVSMSAGFLKQCEHHEEPPEEDGKTELIIEFRDYYLELVEPDYTFYIRPGADVVPDLEAPDLPPPDLAFEEDLVDAPVRKKSPDESAQDRAFMVHKVELIGDRPNSKGKMCAAGYIVLTNAGGGTLSGTAHSTDQSVEVEPARFRGNKVQLSYWVDIKELPKAFEVFILLKTNNEERSISVYEMIGQASAIFVSRNWGVFLMMVPAVFWLSLLIGVFHGISYMMDGALTSLIGIGYKSLRLMQDAGEAWSEVSFGAQAVGYLYLWVAGIVPVMAARIYRTLPPSTQELLEGQRAAIMMVPSMVVGVAMFTPVLKNYFSVSPDFYPMNFYKNYLYFLGLNLASTYYQEMSLSTRLDDAFFTPWARKAVMYAAWFVFLTTILLGVAL